MYIMRVLCKTFIATSFFEQFFVKMDSKALLILCTAVTIGVIGGEFLKNRHGMISYDNCPCNMCDAAYGYCICDPYSWGPSCSERCQCEGPCDLDGTCNCYYNFSIDPSCSHKCGHCQANTTNTCYYNRCICKDNYYGKSCSQSCECNSQNTVFGTTGPKCFSSGQCECKKGTYGKTCDNVCSCPNNQSCLSNGYCRCTENTWGKHCQKRCNCHINNSLSQDCNSYGYCDCKPEFTGQHCSEAIDVTNVPSQIMFPDVNSASYPWVVFVVISQSSVSCLGTILSPFYVITNPECYTKTEQINSTKIYTLNGASYNVEKMEFVRGVTGDVVGPIILKIDSNSHLDGIALTAESQQINLPDASESINVNDKSLGIGLRYAFVGWSLDYMRHIVPGNYTHLSEDECNDAYFRNDGDKIYCVKAMENYELNGCSLYNGSPLISIKEGLAYLIGIRNDASSYMCSYPRVYHFMDVRKYVTWITQIIN